LGFDLFSLIEGFVIINVSDKFTMLSITNKNDYPPLILCILSIYVSCWDLCLVCVLFFSLRNSGYPNICYTAALSALLSEI